MVREVIAMRRLLKSIPAVRFCYGQYRLRRCRRSYGPEYSRLSRQAPRGMEPLHLANSLDEFGCLVRHPSFPPDLLDQLMPPGPGRALDRAYANFARGYAVEQQIAPEWQRPATISEAAERHLTEYLNRYITYALRTFAVQLELSVNPDSSDAIRMRRVLGELEGESGELLDIGCAFVPLAERYAGMSRWVGLDLSLPALAIGRIVNHAPPGSLVCGYSEDLPFPDAAFDVVVSTEVLEHTPRPQRMIAQIARVLRSGGKAVLSVPMHIVDFQDGRQHLIGPTDSTHRFRFHTLEELRALFEQHGLAVERLQSNPHYIFTLRRTQADGGKPEPSVSPSSAVACPDCGNGLTQEEEALRCGACDMEFTRRSGVPVLLPRRLRAARLDLDGAPAPSPREERSH
jgi:SAM-dependent methyltransferase